MAGTVLVVGLGPADAGLLTASARDALSRAVVARLRTRRHPAAQEFPGIPSYDDLYEAAEDFESLYLAIVEDLVGLAQRTIDAPVVYAVPGSPSVAERTVELLRSDGRVVVDVLPAVSVIDMAAVALGIDPMSASLRVVDALAWPDELDGGPLLVLQTYSREVLAVVASHLSPTASVTVLHHLGLPDETVTETVASRLPRVEEVDHLTSVWVSGQRTAGGAMARLATLTSTLRERCVWDQEQTHQSLTRHLLEEAYETIDALEAYAADPTDARHVVEELGDLLFQICFHAEIGHEDGAFDLAQVADHLCDKLIARHPHVFGDVEVTDSADAARRWEALKKIEKGRASVIEGVPLQLPALSLYAALRRKSGAVGLIVPSGAILRDELRESLDRVTVPDRSPVDGATESSWDDAWGALMSTLGDLARSCDIDLESIMRQSALNLRAQIIEAESVDTNGATK